MATGQLIGLLRGVNLGAHNRIAMADLRRIVEDLGYEHPRTLVVSGNVVFGSSDPPATAAKRIEKALASEAGLNVPVLVRTAQELVRIVERNPFGQHAAEGKFHHVIFLSGKADPKLVREVDPEQYLPERFAAHGSEIYHLTPGGMQGAKLTYAFWEKRLELRATARNWNTVEKLAAMASE